MAETIAINITEPVVTVTLGATPTVTVSNTVVNTVSVSQQGARGLSAYQVAVLEGYGGTESEWIDSLHPQWGGIAGDLEDQTDLVAALALKLDDSQATATGLSILGAANAAAATALLSTFGTTTKGLVPSPTTLTGKFLKDDGTWAMPTDAAATWGSISGTLSGQTHLQSPLDAKIPSTERGAASGVASLGSDSKIPTSQLPALAITDVFVVASQVAQLALTAEEGDGAVRSDLNKSYIHNGGTAGSMADWQELLT